MSAFAAAPVFTQTGPFSVTENSSTGSIVGSVVAIGATSYAITAGNGTGSGAFTINNSGVIRVLDGTQLDYEVTQQFTLTVTATNGDGTTLATVIINVQNVNDPPQMTQGLYTFAINENVPNGTLVGAVSATDSDPGDTIVYSILPGPDAPFFAIDSDDGEIKVANTAGINFESGKVQYTIFVQASDGGLNAFATVIITINDANDPPVAVNDGPYAATEDTPLVVNLPANGVLANDTDEDLNPVDILTAVLNTQPVNGSVTLNPDGTFTYTPNPQFDGTDSFTYHASDGTADSNIATVTINVAGTNDAPTANIDAYNTDEDTPLNITAPGVLGNDTDPENNALTAVLDTTTSNGTLTFNSDGSFTYTPNANFNGSDSFTYHANDGTANSSIATVTITVAAVDDVPVAMADSYDTNEDTPLNITAPGVLGNDTDADLDGLTAVLDSTTSNGTLTLNPNGSFTYTPNANFNGTDSFTYHANDGTANSNTVTVTITVAAINDVPVAVADSYNTNEDTPLSITAPGVLGNDTDADFNPLTAVLDSTTSNGSLTLNPNGSFTYTPNANFNGSDSFTYHANDGTANSNTVTVTITVAAINDAPVANDDGPYATDEDTVLSVTDPANGVLDNDTDVEGNPLTASPSTITSAMGAAVTMNADGTFTYNPTGAAAIQALDASDTATDTFTYTVSDGNGGSDTATVSINLGGLNDVPVAVANSYNTNEDTPLNVTAPGVLGNDTDVDADDANALTAVLDSTTSNGSLTLNPNGSFTYTPNAEFSGADSFTYHANDGTANSNTVTVTINVAGVNDAPVITEGTSASVTMSEDGSPTPFALTLNATDPDGNTLTWTISSQGTNGTASASGTGVSKAINYTPAANYNGSDNFVVQVSDGNGGTDTITVNVTITPVNDDPTAVNDAATTPQNTAVLIYTLANDTDIDGDTLSVSAVTNGTNGTVSSHGTHVEYTPAAGFEGNDTFTYTASDGNGGTSVATVTVTVGKTYIYLPMIIKPGPQAPDLVVQSVTATSNLVQVVIKNQGPVATDTGFWVDFYVNPSEAPTHANQLWDDLATEGIAWGVTDSVASGAELTLTYSTALNAPNLYYSAADSNFSGTLAAGTPVYAQVDSAHLGNVNGAVLETHEISGDAYNNVSDEVLATSAATTSLNISSVSNMVAFVAAKFGLPSR